MSFHKISRGLSPKVRDVKTMTEGFLEVISRYGIPGRVLTDQGTLFMGSVFKSVCETLGIGQSKLPHTICRQMGHLRGGMPASKACTSESMSR